MDEVLRLQYLEALGVDVWLPVAGRLFRGAASNAVDLADVQAQTELSGEDPGVYAYAVEQEESDKPVFLPPGTMLLPDGEVSFSSLLPNPIMTGFPARHPVGKCKSAPGGFLPEGEEVIVAAHSHSDADGPPSQDDVDNMGWDELEDAVGHCRYCGLCEARTHAVFGSGNKQADWMLIGEAPGQQEDLQGMPFVGKAGQLLTEMIRAMGLTREEVYITNVLKCRPPNNRDPKPEEMAMCNVYLQRQIQLVQPKMILAVGRIAAQHLLQTDTPIGKLRGKVHYLGDIPLLVIYHPAYLLRSLTEKRKAWDDLQMALRVFRELYQ